MNLRIFQYKSFKFRPTDCLGSLCFSFGIFKAKFAKKKKTTCREDLLARKLSDTILKLKYRCYSSRVVGDFCETSFRVSLVSIFPSSSLLLIPFLVPVLVGGIFILLISLRQIPAYKQTFDGETLSKSRDSR